jgi:hypothetical protein
MATSKHVQMPVVGERRVVTARTSHAKGRAVRIEDVKALVPSSQASVGIDRRKIINVSWDVAFVESSEDVKVAIVNESAMSG